MANRTVTVRYILDASGYRSGANDISASDARIAASARASAAAMDQQQAKVQRGQQKATQAYVAGGKAQAAAALGVSRVTAQGARIQEDAARRIIRVQEDAAQKIGKAKTDQARQEIVSQSLMRQARIREDAEVKASRAAQDAAAKSATQASKVQAQQQIAAARVSEQAQTQRQRAAEKSIQTQLRESAAAEKAAARTIQQEQRAAVTRARAAQQAENAQKRIDIQQAGAGRRQKQQDIAELNNRSAAYSQVGRSALVAGGLIAGGLGLSARAAIQWQSDFTGVSKTVDGNNQQLQALELQLRGLSRELPQSSTAIAAIAENAGQLGIQTGSIAQFTKTMVQLGDTTNLSSDEAATSLAQLGNIMGTLDGPASQVNDTISRTGATVVGLGNDGASTEQQITALALRTAGAGRAIGLSTQEVLGFSSAIASTGVEVEAGGTGFSNFAFKVDAAVRDGGKKLDILAQTAGKSSDEFKKAYGEDSAQAPTSFIEGLGRAQDAGQDTNGVLKSLGVTGIREADVIRRLALSGDLLSKSLANANESYASNTALTNEASKRYETDAARISIAVNKIKDDAISFGSAALPVVSGVTDQVSKYADKFKNFSTGTQENIVKTAAISGGVLLIGGAALSAAGSVGNLVSGLQSLGATKAGVMGAAKSFGAFGLVIASGVAALNGVVALDRKFKPSTVATIDSTTAALQGLAKTGKQNSLDDLFNYQGSGNKQISNRGLIKITTDINGVGDAFKALDDPTTFDSIRSGLDKSLGFLGIKSEGGVTTARANVEALDQSLKQMATSGQGVDAAKAFKDLAPQALAAGRTVGDLARTDFPAYARAVINATDANGYHITSDQELVDIMGGKVPESLAKAAAGNKDLKAAVNATTGALGGQTKSIAEQLSSYQTAAAGILGIRQGQAGMEQAIDQANQALKINGKTLDVNTEKGRQNRTALDNIAVGTANYVKQLGDQKKSALDVVEANERGRRAYIKQAQEFGKSKPAAIKDANKLFGLPKSVRSEVVIDVKGSGSKKQIRDLNEDIQKLPQEKRAKIVTIAEDKGIKAAKSALKEFDKPKKQKVTTEYDKGKAPKAPKPVKLKILNQFSTEKAPTPKPVTQKVRRVYEGNTGERDSKPRTVTQKVEQKVQRIGRGDYQVPKGGTVTFKSKVDPPKAPKAPKGASITYKSKVESPKAPKPPKGATITYKVKVDKTAKVPVPKGGTVKIKTAVDLSGVQRAKAGVSGVKGKTVSIKTSANLSGVRSVRSAISSLPSSKTITITTVKREVTKKAGGGKVTGPGSNTSDSIDAKLSDEEWVIRASSSKRYGDSIMAALNDGAIPRSVLEPYGYATGGKAGLPPMAFKKGGKVTISQLLAAITNEDPLAEVNDAKKGSKAFKEALKEAAKAVRDFGKTLTDQYVSSSTNGGDALLLQQQGITDLKGLQAKIDQLQKLGLDDTQIAGIVKRASEGDVAGATALADSIIDGGKPLVDGLNQAAKELAKIANALAADTQTKKVRAYATGGPVAGSGAPTADDVPIMASSREWIHPVAAVDYYGEAFMAAVQNRTLPRSRVYGHMASGGQVGVKVVQAPSNTSDFIRALEGVSVLVQSPITGEYLRGHIARIADQQIGSVLSGAGGSR